jgi:hypothetical protein
MRLLRLFHCSAPSSPFTGPTTPPPGLLKHTHAESNDGPANKDDILVADLASGTSTADLAPALKSYAGEFYVIGE